MNEVVAEFVNATRTAANAIDAANAAMEGKKAVRDACVGCDGDESFGVGGAVASTEVAAPVAEEVPPTPLEE